MARYRLDLAYVGSGFNGWQSQPDGSGVQDAVETALKTFLRHPVRVTGASRTDTGVHAEGQVCSFETDQPFDARRWTRALHGLMPDGIGVRGVAPAAADFHPILSAVGKAYRYRIWQGETRLPMLAPFVWDGHLALDLERLRAEAAALVGTHDFTSFCAADSGAKTRVRTIFELAVLEHGPLVDVWVIGDGFLKQMVRSIVGTLIEASRGAPGGTSTILAAKDRAAAGMTAPAKGLTLVEVFYGPARSAASLAAAAAGGFTLAT